MRSDGLGAFTSCPTLFGCVKVFCSEGPPLFGRARKSELNPAFKLMNKSATFSPCRKYRYTLWRHWGSIFTSRYAMFIGLNPSTADETNDDPTIRRCIGYAKEWGYGGLCMTNLFAFRATSPKDMKVVDDPVGPDNDHYLKFITESVDVILAAWGNHGAYRDRDEEVYKMIPKLSYLKLTKAGFPAHPLYLPKGLKPILWEE
jgi:hypothetical protein